MNNIKKDLLKAIELKTIGKYEEALKLYQNAYSQNPDSFGPNQREDFAWTIYWTGITNFKSEEELIENAQFITNLVDQKDFKSNPNCPYTSAVFKVLKHLESQKDYESMICWLDKLDPELLDKKPYRKHNRLNKSKREKYYDWTSICYLKTMHCEKCIEASMTALNEFNRFIDDGDAWHKYRIAKSYNELGNLKEALKYYLEVIKVKHDWYIYRDIADIHYKCGRPFDALEYLCPVALSPTPNSEKANLYYLFYNVFKSFNPEMALKHAQLLFLLKQEKGHSIPYEIEQLDIDSSQLDKRELEKEIHTLWIRYKFRYHNLHSGTVYSYDEDDGHGLIEKSDGELVGFHKNDFEGKSIFITENVVFYVEDDEAVYVRRK